MSPFDSEEEKMSKLTKEKIQNYIKNNGLICPYCGSSSIHISSEIEVHREMAYQNVKCIDCEKEWTDEFTLTGITEVENVGS
jgi:transposase-like protein